MKMRSYVMSNGHLIHTTEDSGFTDLGNQIKIIGEIFIAVGTQPSKNLNEITLITANIIYWYKWDNNQGVTPIEKSVK